MVTYWKQNGQAGLRPICRGKLGQNITDYLDVLMRNAFGNSYFMMFSGTATGVDDSGFANLTSTDIFDVDDVMQVWLEAAVNECPMANNPTGPQGTIVGITTPGVIYDIQAAAADDSHWKSVQLYQNIPPISRYEVGQYKQARFLQTTRNILWNCGTVSAQTTLAADVDAGDGAPTPATKVRGVYGVGEADATHYITVTDSTGFSAKDRVSIQQTRESDGRAKWDDGTKIERVIYAVDPGGDNTLSFERPILKDLTASDTWYITRGLDVHMTVFIAGPNGVAAGVGQRPQLHTPPPVDDFESMYRFSWDAWIKYQQFRPEYVYLIFSAGSTGWS